jgi:hypothetical protein
MDGKGSGQDAKSMKLKTWAPEVAGSDHYSNMQCQFSLIDET